MCGGGGQKVVYRDVEKEAKEAERDATLKANAELAYQKNRRKASSLTASSALSRSQGYGSAIGAAGKDTLG